MRCSDVLDAQARGVAGDQRIGSGTPFDVAEQGLLGIEVFVDGFDDDIGAGHAGTGGVGYQPVERRTRTAPVAPELAGKRLRCALHGRRDALGAVVLQRDLETAQGAPGRDIAAHDTGADHMTRRIAGCAASSPLPKPRSRSRR
jgi:hypothetical protein